jgi:excisionase family DNA binding protein
MPNSQSTLNPILLSERQAAAYLSISVSTIRRWRYAGSGPEHFRCGDIIRYRKEDLDAFVDLHSTIPQTMSAA